MHTIFMFRIMSQLARQGLRMTFLPDVLASGEIIV